MGYRSDVYIAVSKELYVKCQLLNNIPKCLQELEDKTIKQEAAYWFIEGWKWYDRYPEIQEIEAWFDWCLDEDENPIAEEYLFGAIRLGEETGDIDRWGEPEHFDLWVQQNISRP